MLQFASGPSDFSVRDVAEDELHEGAARGVKVLYEFPWGTETLETLWILGDTELLRRHPGSLDKLKVSGNVFPAENICPKSQHI